MNYVIPIRSSDSIQNIKKIAKEFFDEGLEIELILDLNVIVNMATIINGKKSQDKAKVMELVEFINDCRNRNFFFSAGLALSEVHSNRENQLSKTFEAFCLEYMPDYNDSMDTQKFNSDNYRKSRVFSDCSRNIRETKASIFYGLCFINHYICKYEVNSYIDFSLKYKRTFAPHSAWVHLIAMLIFEKDGVPQKQLSLLKNNFIINSDHIKKVGDVNSKMFNFTWDLAYFHFASGITANFPKKRVIIATLDQKLAFLSEYGYLDSKGLFTFVAPAKSKNKKVWDDCVNEYSSSYQARSLTHIGGAKTPDEILKMGDSLILEIEGVFLE